VGICLCLYWVLRKQRGRSSDTSPRKYRRTRSRLGCTRMKWNVATDAGTDKETVSDICDDDVCQYMSSLIPSPNVSM
jgi:hypothetical protein